MNKDYAEARKTSYANQNKSLTVGEGLNKIVTIPLGFQPFGIAALGNNQIAITAYFEPAVCLAKVRSYDVVGMHFTVDWIRGVKHGGKSVRLFPNLLKKGEGNRAQTVNFESTGSLWISRNGDNQLFNIAKEGVGWELTKRTINIPTDDIVWSAHLDRNTLLTIECALDAKSWWLREYSLNERMITRTLTLIRIFTKEIPPFIAGVTHHDGSLWHITDFRSTAPHGIYRDDKLVIPNIYGNGLCFLKNGSILATRYGQASPGPFNGEPGALIYVPAHLL